MEKTASALMAFSVLLSSFSGKILEANTLSRAVECWKMRVLHLYRGLHARAARQGYQERLLAVWIEMTHAEGHLWGTLSKEGWTAFHFKQCLKTGVLLCGHLAHSTVSQVLSDDSVIRTISPQVQDSRSKDWQTGPLRVQLQLHRRSTYEHLVWDLPWASDWDPDRDIQER